MGSDQKGSPDGKLYVLWESPIGAMWNAAWLTDSEDARALYAGPDGKAWCLMMPGGVEWIVYGPSRNEGKNGPKWTVTGTPPIITAHPSIAIAKLFHGFVQNGVVSPDCEGRMYKEPFTA